MRGAGRAALLLALFLAVPVRAQGGPKAAAPGSAAAKVPDGLAAWIGGWFAWGEGDVVIEKESRTVPGWTAWHATKTWAAPLTAKDRVDVLLSADGTTALLGSAFFDEERAAVPSPVKGDADLASVREFLKSRVLGPVRVKLSLDASRDVPGFRGARLAVETGYGTWDMPAYVSAADGAHVVLGRAWRRDRSIPEQRRALIDTSETPAEGPANAKVTLVEYSDMQCPMCKKRSADLPALLGKLEKDLPVRRYVKTYPLTEIHPWSFRAASAGRCFYRKDPKLFFSFRSNVFARQEQLDVASLDAFVVDFATANGVADVLQSCYLQPSSDERVLRDLEEGFTIGVRSTPSFFVDGVLVVWFDDPFMEEFLRKTYLGGRGLPVRTPEPKKGDSGIRTAPRPPAKPAG